MVGYPCWTSTPVPSRDALRELCACEMSFDFNSDHDLYAWFDHLKQTSELSPRTVDLTQILLLISTSDYYALMVRADCKP